MDQDDPLSELRDKVKHAYADVQHIAVILTLPVLSATAKHDCLKRAEHAIEQLEQATHTLSMNPASLLGSIGGRKTAERGPEYFRQIAAMRKTHGGGRPRKKSS